MTYLCGLNFGYFYFSFRSSKAKKKFKIIKLYQYKCVRIFLSALSIVFFVAMGFFFSVWFKQFDNLSQVIISQAFSLLVCLAILLLCMPGLLGYSGIVKVFVYDHTLNYLSKLSFSAYSMQYMIIVYIIYNRS